MATNRQHIRRQRLDRYRKPHNEFLADLTAQGTRLGVPARVIRDLMRQLENGNKKFYEIQAAANAAAAGVVKSSAATLDLVGAVADDGDAPFLLGAKAEAPLLLGLDLGTPRLGASTGSLAVAFVDGGGSDDTITRAAGSFITDGFRVGATITCADTDEAGNAGPFVLTAVAALTLTVATGSLTADAADTCTITSLDVVSGIEAGAFADLIAGAHIAPSSGANAAAQYEVDSKGADFVLLADPLSAFQASQACLVLDQITRTDVDGDFEEDGFRVDDILNISGSEENDEASGAYLIASVSGANMLATSPTALLAAEETAAGVATLSVTDRIYRDAGDFEADGFAAGDRVYSDGVLIGVINTLVQERIELVAPLGAAYVGEETDTLTGDVTITRASGSFVTDGFAAGDKVLLVGSESDAMFLLGTVAALTMKIVDPQVVLPEDAAEAIVYKLSSYAREDADPSDPS